MNPDASRNDRSTLREGTLPSGDATRPEVPPDESLEADQRIDQASDGSFPASDASSLTCVVGIRLVSRP